MSKRRYKIAERDRKKTSGAVYNKTILDNGLKIISEEVSTVESFALGVSINAGSRHDPEGLAGAAHFLEHAAFRNTRNRNFKQIAAQFESLGAYFNAFTTKEYTNFYVRALKKHFDKTLELLMDVTFNPVFSEKDADKERMIIIEEIKGAEDDPEDIIFDYGDKLIFGDKGIGNPIMGSAETVGKIKRDELNNFYTNMYCPENIVISVAGNVSHRRIVKGINKHFDRSETQNFCANKTIIDTPAPLQAKSIEITHSSGQTHYLRGYRVEGMNSADRYPMAVLNVIFGDGMSSRLHRRLREKHGLAYSVYSSPQMYADCGAFYIYAGIDGTNLKKLKRMISEETRRLIEKSIPKTELNRAKEQLKTGLIMDLESMSNRMEALAKSEFLIGKHEDIPSTIAAVDSVTAENIQETAKKYFANDDFCEVLMKPEK
ncbi:MAG: insulinase family protein [Chlorobi bacterium]|nr:insulinase family protein [Chlorobiota bacterium]